MFSVHILHIENGKDTEIARMQIISHRNGSHSRSDFQIRTLKRNIDGRFYSDEILDEGVIGNYAHNALPIWYLVMCALHACGYRIPNDANFVPPFPHEVLTERKKPKRKKRQRRRK